MKRGRPPGRKVVLLPAAVTTAVRLGDQGDNPCVLEELPHLLPDQQRAAAAMAARALDGLVPTVSAPREVRAMTNHERVLSRLHHATSPLDDDELARRAEVGLRRQVNQICRTLVRDG